MTLQSGSTPIQASERDAKGRVIIVTPDIVGPVKNGGIGTACFHYARSLANAGYHAEVLFSGTIGEVERQRWARWYDSFGIDFHTMDEIPSIGLTVYGCRWHVERAQYILTYLRERTYDYIIFQDWHANGFWAARAKRMGVAFGDTPIGLISHSPNQWQKEGMQTFGSPVEDCSLEWAEKETIAAVDILISPSHHMVDWLRAHGYRLPDRVVTCPYTFEDETLEVTSPGADVGHLIFFGRLETRKGLHLLGGALRELQTRGGVLPRKVSWLGKLAEVNGIPTMDYLRALETDLGTVEFVVKTDFDYVQAVEYIRTHNGVVVIPSILDNYPLTVIESVTNGFCFLASDAGGIPEMIDPAVCFERTPSGLRAKLEELSTIDFASLRHAYDPVTARRTWLEHVGTTVAAARRTPRATATRRAVPPVSVCVPFYRHDQYVDRLVYAFLRMDLPDLQFVFVNDGTPPEERTCFDALRRELEPLGHVFHDQVNAGPGAARNKAVELARHDLLLFFDADNVPFPDMVERLCDALMSASADSMAAPFVGIPPMLRLPVPEDVVMQFRPPGGPVALALIDNVVGDVCSLVRRQVVEALGGFCDQRQSWEDLDFFVRAVAGGFRHFVYPDPVFFYTMDAQGRNLTAATHMNYRNLLRSLRSMPREAASEVAEIFAMQFLVSRRRQHPGTPHHL
jgi:glycosyltransferase involved in cell wall biosynthesis/GT2 family glycosyltransferase